MLSWVKKPGETRLPIRSSPSCAIVLAGEQPHQVRLARAVGADQPDALAEVDLLLERDDEPVDADAAQVHDDPRRLGAGHPHDDLLLGRRRRRRAGLDEPLPARLGRVGALGVAVVHRGPLLHDLVEPEQAPLLALPLLEPVAEQLLAAGPRLGIGAVGAAVHPAAAALEREDPRGRRAEQVAVVGDEQHGLLRGGDARLERELRRHVEEVVGLVEEQDLRVAREEHLEHEPLALPAGELGGAPRTDVVEARADDRAAGGVPLALELVAAELRPVRDRLAQAHAGVGRVPARVEVALGGEHLLPRRAQPRGRELEEHLPHRALVRADADVLRHVGERADVGVALDRVEPAGEDPQQRRLADAVGADEADVLAAADLEGDVGEEQVAAGMGVGQVGDDDVRHDAG